MANYIAQSQWQYPTPLLLTTQQSAAEINARYQRVANCGEFLRSQAGILLNAATALLSEIDSALANLTAQTGVFNTLAIDAGDKVTLANTNQAIALNASNRITSNNAAVLAAKAKLTAGNSNAEGVISGGMPRSANLLGIAAAPRANPGILGLNNSSVWTWYSAPSGAPFIIEYQAFCTEVASNAYGGTAAAASWSLVSINKAYYGNFRNGIGFPEDVIDEANNRLTLKQYPQYWQIVTVGSNTDAMRVRMTLDGAPIANSLSTQMAADGSGTVSRHFNQESAVDAFFTPSAETTYLQVQSYHNISNPGISVAAKGVAGGKGNNNIFMVGYGFRIRNA